MPTRNIEFNIDKSCIEYQPFGYGMHSGKPTVVMELDESVSTELSTIDSMFSNYNWKNKLSSGFSRLLIRGDGLLDDDMLEKIEAFDRIIDPRFVDFEIREDQLKEPSRTLQRIADSYTIRIDPSTEEVISDDGMRYFTERINMGNVQYVFEFDVGPDIDRIEKISREYKIYDSDIWVYPKGVKPSTIKKRWDKAYPRVRQNQWNLCSRGHEIMEMMEDE